MSFENIQNNFANATAVVVDRTFTPPRVLGQAFVISKSRAVTCASAIFNYVEAPWALAINFLHPDLVYGAKTITLHPEFDKSLARNSYLAQTGWPGQALPAQLNDLAIIILDPEMSELQVEKVAQLHKALTLPFSTVGVEASGFLRPDEFLPLVNKLVEAKNYGLLTLFDGLNLPIARIQFDNGEIVKVHFGDIVNELAFSELLFRNPVKSFALQSQTNVNWGDFPSITVPTESLITEVLRRTNELPAILSALGGTDARYQRVVQEFDFDRCNPEMRPLIEALWPALDGYITLDKLSQIIGVDTYLVTIGLKELINFGVVSLLNRTSPFACGGQLGTPLTSHMDFDINPGDTLLAFYLNPSSGAPTWRQGSFAGVASVLQPKNLLHTIVMPNSLKGALILKDYKLVGVHGGLAPTKGAQGSNVGHSQMMWIGALLDMTSKKLRASENVDETVSEMTSGSLRNRTVENEASAAPVKVEKLICPSCFATNAKPGPCFNCGTEVEAAIAKPEPTDALGKSLAKFHQLKEKYGLSRVHLAAATVVLFLLPLICFVLFQKPPQLSTETSIPKTSEPPKKLEPPSSPAAAQIASSYAGFPDVPPPSYWYEDTQARTSPAKSFALKSITNNQNLVFLIVDDLSAVQNLSSYIARPPFTGLTGAISVAKIDSGTEVFSRGSLNWFVGRYRGQGLEILPLDKASVNPSQPATVDPLDLVKTLLVCSFAGKAPNTSILLVGSALDQTSPYDYKSTLWLVDQMCKQPGKEVSTKEQADDNQDKPDQDKSAPDVYASDEEINTFCQSVQKKIQAKYSLPSDVKDQIAKKKLKRPKVALMLDIGDDGQLKKIEITEQGETEKVTNILVKDVNACLPFENVPKTKEGFVSVLVNLKKDQIAVERP
jgi:hypothetical protein